MKIEPIPLAQCLFLLLGMAACMFNDDALEGIRGMVFVLGFVTLTDCIAYDLFKDDEK